MGHLSGQPCTAPPEIQTITIGGIPTSIFNEHQWALYVWQRAVEDQVLQKGAHLVHVDAHADIIGGPGQVITNPQHMNLGMLAELFSRRAIDCSDFIAPGIYSGIINRLTWIAPEWEYGHIIDGGGRIKGSVFFDDCRIQVCTHEKPAWREADPKKFAGPITEFDYFIGCAEAISAVNEPWVLDIDLDYFSCKERDHNSFDSVIGYIIFQLNNKGLEEMWQMDKPQAIYQEIDQRLKMFFW